MAMKDMRKYIIGGAVAVVVMGSAIGGAMADRMWGLLPQPKSGRVTESQRVVSEESTVINVAEKVSPSVVTVRIKKTEVFRVPSYDFDPFSDPFGFFRQEGRTQERNVEQDIGTGFVISADGLIVTNRHVVGDTQAKYEVITKDDKAYEVQKIYRDPVNDLAILKIETSGLTPEASIL